MSCTNVNTTGSTVPGSADIDFYLAVAKGDFTGYSNVSKFGYNPSIGSSNYETIWEGGGAYPFLASADTLDVVSDSTDDDDTTGIGAWTVELQGLASDYTLLTETVTLDGTTPVTTSGSFYRIFRARTLTAGTNNTNVGTITISDTSTSTTRALISPDQGQTLMAVYTVPDGKTAYIVAINVGCSKDLEMTYRLRVKNGSANAAWQIKEFIADRGGFMNWEKRAINSIAEHTDIDLQAIGSATSSASGGFGLILIDN